MNPKVNFLIAAVVSLLICQQNLLNAQSFGIEIGTAGVENFDPGVLNLGFSINLPLNDKVCCDLSFNFWQGEDGNLKYFLLDYPSDPDRLDWLFWGNNGLNLTIFYKIYGTNKFSTLIGSGLGGYQMIKLNQFNDKRYFYQSTYSFSTLLKYKISELFVVYGKALINTSSLDEIPNWGIFNLGIELSPFK